MDLLYNKSNQWRLSLKVLSHWIRHGAARNGATVVALTLEFSLCIALTAAPHGTTRRRTVPRRTVTHRIRRERTFSLKSSVILRTCSSRNVNMRCPLDMACSQNTTSLACTVQLLVCCNYLCYVMNYNEIGYSLCILFVNDPRCILLHCN